MKTYGTWDAFLIEDLAEQGDVCGYLSAVMEEYHTHGNISVIQIALRIVVEAQGGIHALVKKNDIEYKILNEVLESIDAPRIDSLRTIFSALGCCLSIKSLDSVNTQIEDTIQEVGTG